MRHRDIFLAALDLPAAERAVFLERTCGADPELRRLVEELLLSHEQAGSFLEHPAFSEHTRTAGEGVATPSAAGEPGAADPDELSFLAPSPTPGSLGRLAYYDVREVVGRGGMGIVLKAVDTKLQRVVAIKVLAPQLAASGTARQRFLREAHAGAAVRDDHVVGIYAIGDDGPVPYLVMEYIAGITLDDRIKQGGPLDVKEVLRIGMQIARGLAAAHAQGLIHRDIKPANILLENGVQRVKITDFGLARAGDDASLTQSGVIAGTPMYMSPEQAEGRPVDPRTDLFSLGSVLYAMCTGRPPFRAESTMAVLKRVCEETPRPIREVNPDVPDWLAVIVMKLLAKDPAQRFPSAKELADLLGQHLAHLQQPDLVAMPKAVIAPAAGSPWWCAWINDYLSAHTHREARRRHRWRGMVATAGAMLIVLLAGVVVIAYHGWRAWQHAPLGQHDAVVKGEQPFRPRPPLTPDELAKLPSPLDGRKRDDIHPDLLALAGGGDPTQAPSELVAVVSGPFGHVGQVWSVAFSPDGKLLASAGQDRAVRLWDLAAWKAGAPVPLAHELLGHTNTVSSVAFSPDGKLLASVSSGGVILWNVADGGTSRTLPWRQPVWSNVAFSPDGKMLAVGCDHGFVWRCDVATETLREPLHMLTHAAVNAVAYSPDGRVLATKADTDGAVRLAEAVPGGQFRISELFWEKRRSDFGLTFSPDGRKLAFAGGKNVQLNNLETQTGITLTGHTGLVHGVAFHPAGQLLASASDDHTVRFWDLSSPGRSLTLGPGPFGDMAREVAFDPTGRYLATANWNGTVTIFRTPTPPVADAPGSPKKLPDPKELAAKPAAADALKRDDIHPALCKGLPPEVVGVLGGPAFALPEGAASAMTVSADGKRLAVACGGKIVLFDAHSGRRLRTLTEPNGRVSCLALSPDGKRLADGSWDDKIYYVRAWNAETGEAGSCYAAHTGKVNALAFSPDGKRLVSTSDDGTAMIWAKVWNGSDDLILRGHKGAVFSAAFSPDGKRVATGGADKAVRLWDAETGKPIEVLEGHGGDVMSVAFSPDGKLLASGSWEEWKLWDADALKEVRTRGKTAGDWLAFAPDGQSLWAGGHKASPDHSSHHVLTRWGLDRKPLASLTLKEDGVLGYFALNPDGRTLYANTVRKEDSTLRTYDTATGKERAPQGDTGRLLAAAVSPDGTLLASAGEDSLIKLWDLATGELKLTLSGHTGKVRGVAFSPDGKRLASQGEDGMLRLWDPANGKEITLLARGKADGWGVAFSPDGRWLASCSRTDGGVSLWDVAALRLVRVFHGLPHATRLAFSPDSRLLACGSLEATFAVWDVASGWQVRDFRGPHPVASSVAFSPDGRWLAAGSVDGTVKRWDVTTGAEVGGLRKFDGPVDGVAFDPAGRLLAASSNDGTVHLRDVSAEPSPERTIRLPAGCEGLVFTPEGRYLAVPCHDGMVYVLRLAKSE